MTPAMERLRGKLCAALERHLRGDRAALPPDHGRPLWNAFAALSARRGYGPAGPQPIAYAEIEAWARLMRAPLEPHHVETIVAMDRVWLAHAGKAPEARPAADLTAALFDARFG